ncbi:peptidase inhibitor family I36 protein [Actinosynnema sp. NPDC020468]|uniref:peptidase inhibitor family I36 protein n=1 Tax=Actinosynnema sp. NPDC020468 TaxID=3154488 RepID=UPI0033E0FE85
MSTRTVLGAVAITVGALASTGTAAAQQDGCERGEFCVWTGPSYTGARQVLDVETANPGSCVPLAAPARSFVNRLTRDVTVYQGPTCSTEADFTTYPGHGTYVPDAPFVVRAVQVWQP